MISLLHIEKPSLGPYYPPKVSLNILKYPIVSVNRN